VFPLNEDHNLHNRLTHSLEVSCVGRKLSDKIFEKDHNLSNIISAACLIHDIGNPPFGHVNI
jgi:dGTPase